MSAGAPFALLATTQLLAVAAWGALAGGALFPRLRGSNTPFTVAGALLLGVAEAIAGSRLGDPRSDGASWLRAAGAIVLLLGLARGAPLVRSRDTPVLAVAPLAATLPPALTAAAALTLAALLVARRAAPARLPLAAGLLLSAAASLLSATLGAGDGTARGTTVALLVLRGLGAIALLGWATTLARENLLAKLVASILSSVVLASIVLAAVLGTVVTRRLSDEQAGQVADVSTSEVGALGSVQRQIETFGQAVAVNPTGAAKGIAIFNDGFSKLVATVLRSGFVDVLPVGGPTPVSGLGLRDLAASPIVRDLFAGTGRQAPHDSLVVIDDGGRPVPMLLSAATDPSTPLGQHPTSVAVYGVVVTPNLLQVNRRAASAYGATLVAFRGGLAASSLPQPAAAAVARDPRVLAALRNPLDDGSPQISVSGGSEPTLAIVTYLQKAQPVALLVVSADAAASLATQRLVLEVLFLTLLGATLITTLLAVLLSRQLVDPVRRLTAAADRVRGGDLSASSDVTGRDEVGRLAVSFDAMTSSLGQAAADLRATAEQEASVRGRLETVLAAVTDGLVVADAAGDVESVNPAAAALVGPVLGRPLVTVLQGLDVAPGRMVEGLLHAPDGRPVPVVASAAALADGAGVVVVLRDTSRESEIERMKTEFLSNVSHELRTPLTPIKGYADILARRAATLPPEKTAQYAGVMVASAVRLSRVVDLLVDVAALDAGRVRPVPERLAVEAFVDGRLAMWRQRVPERAADLRRRLRPGLPDAYVDPAWLAKAVDELVDNALKYSAAGTQVTLVAASEDAALQLTVRDAGEGIAADRLAGLFTDFEQVDGSATRARDGLGLGLAFVRRVADVVGLRLSVASTQGRGSAFTLEVPVLPVTPAPRAPR